MELNALIFDVDGTLAETEDTHRDAFNQAFAERALPWVWDRELYARLLTTSGGRERIRAFIATSAPHCLGPGCDALIAALHKRKTEIFTARAAAGAVPLRPGIARLIAEARGAGVRLAIATTTTRANVSAVLGDVDWFEVMACSDDAPAKKPDPQIYTFVLDRLGLPAAACLAIEDSRNGVQAARAAGLPVVVTRSAYTGNDDVGGALAVWPNLSAVGLAELRRLHFTRQLAS